MYPQYVPKTTPSVLLKKIKSTIGTTTTIDPWFNAQPDPIDPWANDDPWTTPPSTPATTTTSTISSITTQASVAITTASQWVYQTLFPNTPVTNPTPASNVDDNSVWNKPISNSFFDAKSPLSGGFIYINSFLCFNFIWLHTLYFLITIVMILK
jgi:hypothetical protein